MAVTTAHVLDAKYRTEDIRIQENVDFKSLFLSEPVLEGLTKAGFVRPSPIQFKAIPMGRCGVDLIVQAKSGTGKTCVFTVIALESIILESYCVQSLILAPTREIAVQIAQVILSIGASIPKLRCYAFIGGTPFAKDKFKLRQCHIAVGTPGRIKQLMEEGFLRTDSIRLFVLDEADKLIAEGFQEAINWIYSCLPENKQMIALSATYPPQLAELLTRYMRNPTFARLNSSDPALLGVKQYYKITTVYPLPQRTFDAKVDALIQILNELSFNQCLIFCNYQIRAQMLAGILTSHGWPTIFLAGSQAQTQRLQAMATLKQFQCRILVSTDLTARGIDAEHVNLVINLDVPSDSDTYLHRIGRAGRYGTIGLAVTLSSEGKELDTLETIKAEANLQLIQFPDTIDETFREIEKNSVKDKSDSNETQAENIDSNGDKTNEEKLENLPNNQFRNVMIVTADVEKIPENVGEIDVDESEQENGSVSVEISLDDLTENTDDKKDDTTENAMSNEEVAEVEISENENSESMDSSLIKDSEKLNEFTECQIEENSIVQNPEFILPSDIEFADADDIPTVVSETLKGSEVTEKLTQVHNDPSESCVNTCSDDRQSSDESNEEDGELSSDATTVLNDLIPSTEAIELHKDLEKIEASIKETSKIVPKKKNQKMTSDPKSEKSVIDNDSNTLEINEEIIEKHLTLTNEISEKSSDQNNHLGAVSLVKNKMNEDSGSSSSSEHLNEEDEAVEILSDKSSKHSDITFSPVMKDSELLDEVCNSDHSKECISASEMPTKEEIIDSLKSILIPQDTPDESALNNSHLYNDLVEDLMVFMESSKINETPEHLEESRDEPKEVDPVDEEANKSEVDNPPVPRCIHSYLEWVVANKNKYVLPEEALNSLDQYLSKSHMFLTDHVTSTPTPDLVDQPASSVTDLSEPTEDKDDDSDDEALDSSINIENDTALLELKCDGELYVVPIDQNSEHLIGIHADESDVDGIKEASLRLSFCLPSLSELDKQLEEENGKESVDATKNEINDNVLELAECIPNEIENYSVVDEMAVVDENEANEDKMDDAATSKADLESEAQEEEPISVLEMHNTVEGGVVTESEKFEPLVPDVAACSADTANIGNGTVKKDIHKYSKKKDSAVFTKNKSNDLPSNKATSRSRQPEKIEKTDDHKRLTKKIHHETSEDETSDSTNVSTDNTSQSSESLNDFENLSCDYNQRHHNQQPFNWMGHGQKCTHAHAFSDKPPASSHKTKHGHGKQTPVPPCLKCCPHDMIPPPPCSYYQYYYWEMYMRNFLKPCNACSCCAYWNYYNQTMGDKHHNCGGHTKRGNHK